MSRPVEEHCKHCGRVWNLHQLPDYACPDGENLFTPTMPKGYDTKQHLIDLVQHCWIYSGYKNNGYDKMSLQMKSLYHYCQEVNKE